MPEPRSPIHSPAAAAAGDKVRRVSGAGQKSTDLPRFRLAARGSGDGRSFVLEAGRHGVGSDPSNAVRLEDRGISRFHAALTCRAGDCELEDLSSKNGSSLNGSAVQHAFIAHGDVLGFGALRFTFEVLPAGDSELALEFSAPRPDPTTLLGASVAGGAGAEAGFLALFRCLRAIEERFRHRAEPDYAGALAVLAGQLGLAGAALYEQPRRGAALLLAGWGRLPAWPAEAELAAATPLEGDPSFRTLTLAEGGLLVYRREPAGGSLAICAGGLAGNLVSPTLLATCLLVFGERGEATAEPPPAAAPLKLPPGIVAGGAPAMSELYRQIALVARGPMPVLVLGETGTGKEHVARALHDGSERAAKNFVAINCAAIPAELLEAELFGIGAGVATGVKGRRGRFLEAEGGTLFLDEIGDLPLALQAKLLRVLQEGEVMPLGERPLKVDVRILAASHVDLGVAIAERRFREDLFYRLAGYVLKVPPLRERLDDLPALLGRFLEEMGREAGRPVRGVTVKALEELRRERWPGNVRQLQQVARRLVYLCPRGQAIDSRLVAEALAALPGPAATEKDDAFVLGRDGLEEHLGGLEKEILEQALAETEGNRTKAATLLKISRNSLARRLERLGLAAEGGEAAD